jgi:hypothetical protein
MLIFLEVLKSDKMRQTVPISEFYREFTGPEYLDNVT